MDKNKLCVSIIGGSGFIGSKLTEMIPGDYDVRVLDVATPQDGALDFREVDVRDHRGLLEAVGSSDIIVNLAAEHRDDVFPRRLYDEVNVGGAENCCRVARELGVNTIIFTSSVAIYGFAEPGSGEDCDINPFNDYGRTKAEAEKVYRDWQAEAPEERALVIIRPTAVFGEGNRGNVYNLMRQIAGGKFLMVGKGLNRKSLAYVDNVAGFIVSKLTAGPGVHVHNYVDQPSFNMNELVTLVNRGLGKSGGVGLRLPRMPVQLMALLLDGVARMSGKTFPISSVRITKFCSDTHFSSNAFETGYQPKVGMEDAILRTVQSEFSNSK